MQVSVTTVSEESDLQTLYRIMLDLPKDTCILLCICHKMREFGDSMDDATLYAFRPDNIPTIGLNVCLEGCFEERCAIPDAKMRYVLVTASKAELELQVQLYKDDRIESPELKTVLRKYLQCKDAFDPWLE